MMNRLYAGVSKRDITISGVGPERVRDPLYARCLLLDDGSQRFAILALDAVGIGWISDIPNDFLATFRQSAEERFGIPASHILVSATHTHPSNDKAIHCTPEELQARCLACIEEALNARTEVSVSCGKTEERRLTMNRTLRLKDGKAWSVRHSNPAVHDEDVRELGPLDPTLGILRLVRTDTGATLAVLFNFACHPLWAEPRNRISANYPGVACRVIEKNLQGAMAIFLQGAAGDVIDRGFKDFESDRARFILNMGTQLGLDVLQSLPTLTPSDPKLAFATRTVRLPRRRDISDKIKELDQEALALQSQLRYCPLDLQTFLGLYLKYQLRGDYPLAHVDQYLADEQDGFGTLRDMDEVNRYNIQKYLDNVAIMEKLARLADRKATFEFHRNLNGDRLDVGAEVNALRIGDFVLITSPTEMLTQVALNIKNASPFPYTFISAYCNGYLHYGSPEDDYPRDGYEVTECMLAPGWQKIHEDAARQVLQEI